MRRQFAALCCALALAALLVLDAARGTAAEPPPAGADPAKKRVPLDLKLPGPAYKGTETKIPLTEHRRKPTEKLRPPFHVPEGTQLISLGKPVTASDEQPLVGHLEQITDGDKEGSDGSYVELAPGKQWVQIDLKGIFRVSAIVVWHFHGEMRLYRDVVVQVADDPDFITNVRTLFNNDYDNSSGLGIGKDPEYFENREGELIDGKGETARYVRFYSNGHTFADVNHYVEVEVHGIPAK
jgi:hypothetical protein